MKEPTMVAGVLAAAVFAAERHRDQRRKGEEAAPYVNHALEVAELLARVGGVADVVTLQAALLHDTVEDTSATPEALEAAFGAEVRRVVEEVTDDRRLSSPARKEAQVRKAPHLSPRARLVKLADKVSNVRAIVEAPPPGWSHARRRDYVDWTARVVAGLRGSSAPLERLYDETLAAARRALE
jgi:(p)ppGpp synthase/HD superfamily hydrolase